MSEKIIRDPVHDVIAFRKDRPLDRLLFNLINASEFQRLRRVRQLGLAHLAYPGADHSRYSHSLGVMETARRMLDQLRRSHTIDEEQEVVCVTSALLHDLGHGPFSHVFERVSGIDHEDLTRRVIEDPEGDVHRTLAAHDRALPSRVLAFLAEQPRRTFFNDILSSQLDADRFDYLLRDNLMTGCRYGDYDLRWLIQALTIDTTAGRIAISWKGLSAVESYLQARYHMYRNVYFHKVVRSAEGMLKLALQRARRLAVQDRLEWPPRDTTVYKALLGQKLSVVEFTEFDDVSVLHCFKLWTRSDDAVLAGLCRGLLFRRVYKTIDLTRVDDPAEMDRLLEAASSAIDRAGGESSYDMFYDEPKDTPYEVYQPQDGGEVNEILISEADGKLVEFASLSPMTQALSRQLMFRRLHVSAEWKEVVESAIR